MPYRTFDLAEVSAYLHLDPADVERLVKKQDIPFEKRGSRLVFRKLDIDNWASQRILGLDGERLATYHRNSSNAASAFLPDDLLLSGMTSPALIDAALPAKTRSSVLREMVGLADQAGRLTDSRALLDSLLAREELCSTGMPGGFALLHPRYPDPALFDSPFVALGRTVHAVPFGAPDGRGTDLFFLLACPDDRLHLHALARLALMAHKTDLLQGLRRASTADEMVEAVASAEKAVLPSIDRQ